MDVAKRATAFSVSFDKPAPKKKKRSGPFKFLRKDEGTRASTIVSPSDGSSPVDRDAGAVSHGLRQAIASARSRRSDPFADSGVVMPRRPPPPEPAASRINEACRSGSEEERPPAVPPLVPPRREVPPHAVCDPATAVLDEGEASGSEGSALSEDSRTAEWEAPPPQHALRPAGYLPPMQGPPPERERVPGPAAGDDAPLDPRPATSRVTSAPPRYADTQPHSARNYFRRPPTRSNPSMAETEALDALEDELEAAREERRHYQYLKSQLERERQRFGEHRHAIEMQLERDRTDFDAYVAEERRLLRRDVRGGDDRMRQVQLQLTDERDNVKRLSSENESMKEQLEAVSRRLRDTERVHKAEGERLRSDMAALSTRNNELLQMARISQMSALGAPHGARSAHAAAVEAPDLEDDFLLNDVPLRSDDHKPEGRKRDVQERLGRGERQRDLDKERQRREERQRELDKERQRREERQRELDEERRKREERRQELRTERSAEDVRGQRKAPERPDHRRADVRGDVPTVQEMLDDGDPMPPEDAAGDVIVSQLAVGSSGKREVVYRSGRTEVLYSNGARKVILPSGHAVLYFGNGDIKRAFPSGKSSYWYAVAQTTHTQLPSGVQLFQFHATGQTERHLPDGTKEVLEPDGTYRILQPEGTSETD